MQTLRRFKLLAFLIGGFLSLSTALASGRAQLHFGLLGPVTPERLLGIVDPDWHSDTASWLDSEGRAHLIVQMAGVTREVRRRVLDGLGAEVVQRIPVDGFRIAIDAALVPDLALAPEVSWIGPVSWEAKVSPGLWRRYLRDGVAIDEMWEVRIASGAEPTALLAEIGLEAILRPAAGATAPGVARVRARPDRLVVLLERPEVVRVAAAPTFHPTNDAARDTLLVSDLRIERPDLELFGAGQVIGVLDGGFDAGTTDPALLTDDFEDGYGNDRVREILDIGGDGDTSDHEGHGTACAGTALGNGAQSLCDPAARDFNEIGCYAGMAPEAELVFVSTLNTEHGEHWYVFPPDLRDYFVPSHNAGTRIHSNSWGSVLGDSGYEAYARQLDAFLWEYQDDVALFSGGNEAADNDEDGYVDGTNMNQPGTAKNAIAVGATENDRRLYDTADAPGLPLSEEDRYPVEPLHSDWDSNNEDGMARYSSRGPTLDGRYKPDVVAPGQLLISVHSYYVGDPDHRYGVYGGTSLATPLAAGVVALYRQYLQDRHGHTPSGALLKALLLVGARNIAPGEVFPGYPDYHEIPDERPNNVAGWGRVDARTIVEDLDLGRVAYWDRVPLGEGGMWTSGFHLPAEVTDLHAMLVWYDAPGSSVAGGGLVNDLDLSLRHVGTGQIWYPNQANPGTVAAVHQLHPWCIPDWWGGEGYFSDPGGTDGFAVRFTPDQYPCTLTGVGFFLGNLADSPFQFELRIRGVAPGGEPGTVIYSQTVNVNYPYLHQFRLQVPLDTQVPITEGEVFVEYKQLPGSAGIEQSPTADDGRSWRWRETGGWSLYTGRDLGLRAVFESAAGSGPEDRVNPQEGIDLESPPEGEYELTVYAYRIDEPVPGTSEQPFAVVLWGEGADWRENTAIELVSFAAEEDSGAVRLFWETAAESDCAGFHLLRARAAGGEYQRITSSLLPAEGDETGGAQYEWIDEDVEAGGTYWYKLEDIDLHGASAFHGPVEVTLGDPEGPPFGCGTGHVRRSPLAGIMSILALYTAIVLRKSAVLKDR